MKKQLAERVYAESSRDLGGVLRNSLKLIAVVTATALLTEVLAGLGLESESLLMLYMLAVVVISLFTPSYSYGVVAAVLCSFAYDFFITDPRYGFSITLRFPITLLTMLAVTLIISALIVQNKRQADLAMRREQQTKLLYDLNQELLATQNVAEIVSVTQKYIQRQMERSNAFFLKDPKDGGEPSLLLLRPEDKELFTNPESLRRVHQMFKVGVEQPEELLPKDPDIHYEAVVSHGKVLGVIGLDCRELPLTSGTHAFLHIIASRVALALDLRYLSEEQNNLKISAEKEKMRANLLRSISHDLRTPLTSILGASSAILEHEDMNRETQQKLAGDIKENAQWLIRMVENILTVTRISQDATTVHKTMEAAEEIISQAVSIVRKRFPDCLIHVSVPNELLMVPMDATLILQVLINLLENAIKNSEEGALVLLTLKKKGDFARFEVCDHGRGIPERLLSNLFEIHPQSPQVENGKTDFSKGLGIGLSICKTIVQAHGGEIEGCNREEGGARFVFTLPLQ